MGYPTSLSLSFLIGNMSSLEYLLFTVVSVKSQVGEGICSLQDLYMLRKKQLGPHVETQSQ